MEMSVIGSKTNLLFGFFFALCCLSQLVVGNSVLKNHLSADSAYIYEELLVVSRNKKVTGRRVEIELVEQEFEAEIIDDSFRRKTVETENGMENETRCRSRMGKPKAYGNWNVLWIESTPGDESASWKDKRRMFYCAGYAEGFQTAKEIEQFHQNVYADWFLDFKNGPDPEPVFQFLKENDLYVRVKVAEMLRNEERNTVVDEEDAQFWREVHLITTQLDGMYAGYLQAVKDGKGTLSEPLAFDAFLLINADGDVETIVELIQYRNKQTGRKSTEQTYLYGTGRKLDFSSQREVRCSALLKLIEENDEMDVLIGHTTWDHYENASPRYLKSFHFKGMLPHSFTMSSSPGMLSSVDDFYVTGNQLVVVETTNSLYNKELLKFVKPQSVLSWVRARIANTMSSVEDWGDMFEKYNSGTYNNQWMVISARDFLQASMDDSAAPEKNKGFLVLEQMPSIIRKAFMDSHLKSKGYWASYNVPYFRDTYEAANFSAQTPSIDFSHERCPRAVIFKREIGKLEEGEGFNLDTFRRLMRYNKYETDPAARGNACNGISSRCDMNKIGDPAYKASGGMDCKVISLRSLLDGFSNSGFLAQLGPTNYDQPAFDWSQLQHRLEAKKYHVPSHVGQSDRFEFNWVSFGPVKTETLYTDEDQNTLVKEQIMSFAQTIES